MKVKPFKFIFWSLLLLIGLIGVAIVVLPLVIDPNDYKPEIAAAVKKQTGRDLEIEGDIALSVFPWLGLDIGPTRLSNAEGFAEPYMARMEAVQVRIKLVPLLKKQLEVDKVQLSGLQLNLAKDPAGRTNWADLQPATGEDSEASGAGDTPSGDATLESLSIGGIKIVDARLVWDDRSSDSRYEINDLSIITGVIAPGERFDLDLNFKVAASEPAISGVFALNGDVLVAPELNAVEIAGAKLEVDAAGEGVPDGRMKVSLATDIAVDLDAQTLSMPAVVLKALGLNVTGNIAGKNISGDNPQFSGVFNLADFAPRELFKALGQESPVTTDSGVLGSANARLEWLASTKSFTANVVQIHLDDTTVDGSAKIAQFDAPAISFAFVADQFDLDRYLPPATENAKASQTEAAPAGEGDAGELPIEALRGLNLNGTLKIGSLKAFNLNSTNVEVEIKAKDGLLRVIPASAHLYEGNIKNDITFDVRNKTPRLKIVYDLEKVLAGPLLKDLMGDEKLLGTANLHTNITAVGTTAAAIKRSLNGDASFSFTDGAVKGVNVAALIRNARAKLKGEPIPAASGPNQTDFTEMKGSVVINNGVIRNSDLLMSSPFLRISGKGDVSLPEETIDYILTAKLVGSMEGQGATMEDLKGVSIPVRIGGTFSKPSFVPDIAAALTDAARSKAEAKVEEKVEEQKEKIREKLGDKLGDGLQDKLKGLFK